ncbi:MAG: metalloprotease PmbA [Gammaproteobacteria bacterium]|nr:MAG: metalloprotease PmbA [Gammaproteobacteria bacterium]TDJ41968.1 MAG: metalloprotease PmbA [Gammaproteobacteria bacterium]
MTEVTDVSRGILTSVAESEAKLKSLVASILEEAVRAGADAAEVSASEDCGLGVTVRMGELETVEFNRDQGFGITVYLGTRKGSASTSDSSPDAVRDAVRAALNIARFTQEDPCHGLAAAELMPEVLPDLDLYHPWDVSVADAERLALACEDVARDDARVVNSDGASVSTQQSCRAYGNTHGFIGSYLSTRHATSCAVIAGEQDRMQRDHWYTVARRADALEAPEAVGRKAAERTVARLEPGKIATGRYPVLFDAPIASGLIGHLISALSGAALYRRASFLTDSLERAVLPDCYSLVEYPLRTGGHGSAAFDADGVATREQAFVDGGRVARYVLGTYSARRLGLETTGNAGGVHNLDLEGPHRPRQKLLAQMGTGLLVTELMGQGINLVTGDYSRGAAGFWVENGEMAYPVQELTIASNLARMYLGIVGSGDDLDRRGNLLTGSILIDEMTIAAG